MKKYKGLTLTKYQAEALEEMVEMIEALHELNEEDDPNMQDTVDSFISSSENFLKEIGAINKTIF